MSPGYHTPSSRGGVSRWQRPPQSTQTISGSGTSSGSGIAPSLARMRVVAGEFGGRKLGGAGRTTTRPTTDKVREAVFNSLDAAWACVEGRDGRRPVRRHRRDGHRGAVAGRRACTFVERDRDALHALRANIETLGLEIAHAGRPVRRAGVGSRAAPTSTSRWSIRRTRSTTGPSCCSALQARVRRAESGREVGTGGRMGGSTRSAASRSGTRATAAPCVTTLERLP